MVFNLVPINPFSFIIYNKHVENTILKLIKTVGIIIASIFVEKFYGGYI